MSLVMYGIRMLLLSTMRSFEGLKYAPFLYLFIYLFFMKFSIKSRTRVVEIWEEKLTLTIKGVISVSVRQKIMSIMASIFSKWKMTDSEISEIKDGKKIVGTDKIMEAFGWNILTIYEIVADIVEDWDAFDDDGNKLEIEPSIVALVLGDGHAMTIMTEAISPPTIAENSANKKDLKWTTWLPPSSSDEQ